MDPLRSETRPLRCTISSLKVVQSLTACLLYTGADEDPIDAKSSAISMMACVPHGAMYQYGIG